MNEADENFYNRADDHILLSTDQLKQEKLGKVSASMMYGTARFNAWVSACNWENALDMKEAKKETLDYFVEQYRKMLDENLDDFINNFNRYMNK